MVCGQKLIQPAVIYEQTRQLFQRTGDHNVKREQKYFQSFGHPEFGIA